MVISNIGTIVESLASTTSGQAISGTSAASQVRLISLANTFSRLLTGPIADFTSPIPMQHPSGELVFHKKRAVTRVAFVSLSSGLLLLSFLWMVWGVGSGSGLWILSIGTGASYGMIWYSFFHSLSLNDPVRWMRTHPGAFSFTHLGP